VLLTLRRNDPTQPCSQQCGADEAYEQKQSDNTYDHYDFFEGWPLVSSRNKIQGSFDQPKGRDGADPVSGNAFAP